MKKFEMDLLNANGKPDHILNEFFNWKLAPASARKTLDIIKRYIRFLQEKNIDDKQLPDLNNIQIKADGTRTSTRIVMLSEDDLQNDEVIMRKMGFDPDVWEMISIEMNRSYHDVSMKIRKQSGETSAGKPVYVDNPEKHTNHSFRVTVKAKPKKFEVTKELMKDIIENFKSPPLVIYRHKRKKSGLLLENNVPVRGLPIMEG